MARLESLSCSPRYMREGQAIGRKKKVRYTIFALVGNDYRDPSVNETFRLHTLTVPSEVRRNEILFESYRQKRKFFNRTFCIYRKTSVAHNASRSYQLLSTLHHYFIQSLSHTPLKFLHWVIALHRISYHTFKHQSSLRISPQSAVYTSGA
jgi:hypothetical protein